MPARRLRHDATERVLKFSVVGQYLSDAGTLFVQHVAILRADEDLRYASSQVRVWHMGPPLVAGAQSASAADERDQVCTVHLAGGFALEAEDIEGIETWLADVDKEDRPAFGLRHYIAHPPMQWVEAENGTRLYRRFSCAGFVLDCYRSIGVNLIDDGATGNLPETDLETIAAIYGEQVRRERIRDMFGIPGPGPWRIVLAGYVMNALNRPDAAIRASAHFPGRSAERDFPPP